MISELDRTDAVYNAIEARQNRPGVYASPFEALRQSFPDRSWQGIPGMLEYQGTTSSVLVDLENALRAPNQDSGLFSIALQPPRLIRAVIDWKIDHPWDSSEELVDPTLKLALAIYAKNPDAYALLQQFHGRLENDHPQLLTAKVQQKSDLPSWLGTDPERSYLRARELAYEFAGEDILLIALGHGGTAAGLDVFLRYQDITQGDNSAFYVARFSRLKMKDKKPQLTPSEMTQLEEMARGRKIVVFEEDSVSGETIGSAISFFRSDVFNDMPIAQRINMIMGGFTPTEKADKPLLSNNIILKPLFGDENKSIILEQISINPSN